MLLRTMLAAGLLLLPLAAAPAQQTTEQHSFAVEGDHFTLDGKPFQVISGSIHYTRIPRAYWRDRLQKARAMGLNTVETYAFWNAHEPEPGQFDFTGQNDIAEFVREAQQEGLYVILRAGPYACAEWEWGGFPSWLLRDPHMVVRSSYPGFIQATDRFFRALGQQVAPLQIGNGGPILAVQVENEYGSYVQQANVSTADAHSYMEQMHHALVDAGFTRSLLYTANGGDVLKEGSLPELPSAVNFGQGSAQKSFALYDAFRPGGVHFNSEYWDGWFDHWGDKHQTRETAQQLADLGWMLKRGYSVNLYMFDGGTSFGWMNGANSQGSDYQPDVTSYDYDVPIAETGEPRPKFYAFRSLITEVTHITPPPLPPPLPPAISIPATTLAASASLWANLPRPVHSELPVSMESLDQSYGYVLYRTHLKGIPAEAKLALPDMHDYAMVYLDGVFQGAIDRRLGQSTLIVHPASQPASRSNDAGARLDVLVENTGRVNYGPALPGERVGLLAPPTLDGLPLSGWDNYSLHMLHPAALPFAQAACTGPCYYRAEFHLAQAADTYLDTSQLAKGFVWVNGHPLGRFWSIGPQKTLYLPGPWLHAGTNEVVVFDLDGKPGRAVAGKSAPEIDGPTASDPLTASSQ